MNLLSEQMQQELVWLEQGNYKYLGCTVVYAEINTTNLETTSKGIIWTPTDINKGKECTYEVLLLDKNQKEIKVEGAFTIIDIVDAGHKNPSLVLQDNETNVVAGMDGEIQTSVFNGKDKKLLMSKVLGCTVFNKKERQSLIHCETPTIHYEQYDFPSLYMIISDKSIYVGITYRKLSDRIYEHCTLTKDKTVKTGKSTFEMIAHEGAEVYCIGTFTDYTIGQIEAMSEDEKNDFKHRMESVETLMITLAQKEFSHLVLVNRKQILKDDKVTIKHLSSLPFGNVDIHWDTLRDLGYNVPKFLGEKQAEVKSFHYVDEPMTNYYVPFYYHERFVEIINNNRDVAHLNEMAKFDYCMIVYLLLPHYTVKQSNYLLDLIEKQFEKTDDRPFHYEVETQVVYIKVKKKPSNPIQSHQPTTPELKSVDKLIDWDEEDEEWESRFKEEQARFLKIHTKKLNR